MNEKKNIDRLFQEKFKDFEAVPNDAVWDRISESLPKKKKKRRVIALWWQVGGVAAAIALLLTVGNSMFNSDNNSTENPPVIVDTENTKETNKTQDNNTSYPQKEKELNNTTIKLENTELVDSNKNNESNNTEKKEATDAQQKDASKELVIPNSSKSNAVANTSTEKETTTTNSQKQKSLTTNNIKETKVVASNNKNSENNNKTKITDDTKMKSVIKQTIKDNNTAVTKTTASKTTNSENSETKDANNNLAKEKEAKLTEDPNKESITEAIAENTTKAIDEKEKDDEQNRWSIAPNVAPVYFSSLGQGSSIDAQFNQNSKSSDINMSYGIAGTYAVSKKLKIRAGINRVDLSQTTSDVFAFTGGEFASRGAQSSMGNINSKGGLENVTFMSAGAFDRSTTPEIFNTKIAGNIDQRFGFIEIPLELEYRLLDKKFGLNVIGGFSTFFLNQNEIFADIDGTSTFIGEASNINSTSFSANFGLGLDYNLSKQWNINLEPQFKYQINTFNDTSGNFRPFFIGVYTGLSFKF